MEGRLWNDFMLVQQIVPTLIRSEQEDISESTSSSSGRPMFINWERLIRAGSEDTLQSEDDSADVAVPTQRTLMLPKQAEFAARVIEILRNDDHARAWHRSCRYKGSGAWLTVSNVAINRVSSLEYATNLGWRLLLRSPESIGGNYGQCTACMSSSATGARDESFHGLNCTGTKGERVSRHNYIRNLLADTLSRVFGHNVVMTEPQVPGNCRADIQLITGNAVHWIDIAVVNPASVKCCAKGAANTDGAAAAKKELEKRAKYAPVLRTAGLNESALIPFVLETTGRFGEAALAWLDKVRTLPGQRTTVDAGSQLSFLRTRIRTSLLKQNHAMASKMHAMVRQMHGGVAIAARAATSVATEVVDGLEQELA